MLEEGARLFERAAEAAGPKDAAQTVLAAAARRCATPVDRPRPAWPRATAPEVLDVLPRNPLRDLVTAEGPFPLFVDRERALFGSLVRVLPALGGRRRRRRPAWPDRARSRPRRAAARGRRRWASTSSTCRRSTRSATVNRKGPNNTLDPGPGRRRLAVGDRLARTAGTTRSTPTSARSRTSTRSSRAPASSGLEVALDLALQASPDHPWVNEHPEWFTDPRRRHDRVRREPAEEVPGHLPDQLRQRPRRASTPRCCGSSGSGSTHGVRDLPGRQPAHQAGAVLGLADRRGPQDRPGRDLPGRGVHPAGDDAPARQDRLPPVATRTSPGATTSGEIEEYLAELVARDQRPYMRPNFFVNTPDILHEYLQYGGPAAFKIRAVLAATASPTLGRLRRLRAVRARRGPAGQRGVPRLREVPAPAARLGRRRGRGPHAGAVPHPLNEIRRAHPALQRLRNLTFHTRDNDAIIVLQQARRRPDGSDDMVIVVVNLDPHGAREATVHLDMPALGLDWHDTASSSTTRSPAQTWTWGEHNYVRLDPYLEPAHILAVPEGHRDARPASGLASTRPSDADPTGSSAPSSTRCSSGRSPTPTATAPATSAA